MPLQEEIDNILGKDPAVRHWLEVVLCYPGFHAIALHRLSHACWLRGQTVLARLISHLSRMLTGVEIHPGAKIGRRVFIDHGMGVVIGETAEVGNDVVLYQGVTLGAGSDARKGALTRGKKRHPSLGDGVVVGSGAEIQGPITIGNNVQVASGSIVLKSVPDNSVVVGVPGRIIFHDGKWVGQEFPDLEAEAIKSLKEHIERLDAKVQYLRQLAGITTLELDRATATGNQQAEGPVATAASDPVDIFLHGAGI